MLINYRIAVISMDLQAEIKNSIDPDQLPSNLEHVQCSRVRVNAVFNFNPSILFCIQCRSRSAGF